jgi:hypothetical protein
VPPGASYGVQASLLLLVLNWYNFIIVFVSLRVPPSAVPASISKDAKNCLLNEYSVPAPKTNKRPEACNTVNSFGKMAYDTRRLKTLRNNDTTTAVTAENSPTTRSITTMPAHPRESEREREEKKKKKKKKRERERKRGREGAKQQQAGSRHPRRRPEDEDKPG